MNSKINQQFIQEQAALIAQASRVHSRASSYLAAVTIIQDYSALTQRLLAHIHELSKDTFSDGGAVPPAPQRATPVENNSCSGSVSGPEPKTVSGPIMG